LNIFYKINSIQYSNGFIYAVLFHENSKITFSP
jgi:hypothetical protein